MVSVSHSPADQDTQINLSIPYLDNDDAGRDLVAMFQEALPDSEIIDQSRYYQGFEDVNAFLSGGQRVSLPKNKTNQR